ncbi:MAG: PspC domain-containing protein [Acidobacteriota bacterium]
MEQRILRKSSNRTLFGVCGGLAEHFGWDPTLVRFMFILVAFFGGSSIAAYVILLFVMPPALGHGDRLATAAPAPPTAPTPTP